MLQTQALDPEADAKSIKSTQAAHLMTLSSLGIFRASALLVATLLISACGGGDGDDKPKVVIPTVSLQVVGGVTAIQEGQELEVLPTFSSGTALLKTYLQSNLTNPISEQVAQSGLAIKLSPARDARLILEVTYDNNGIASKVSRGVDVTVKPFNTPTIDLSATPNSIDRGQLTTLVPFITSGTSSHPISINKAVIETSIPSSPDTQIADEAVQNGVGIIRAPTQTSTYKFVVEYLQGGEIKTLEKSIIVSVNPPAAFTRVGDMSIGRAGHTATPLNNQRVLITGGFDGSAVVGSAEIYDSGAQGFSISSNEMTTARADHSATVLPNGKVLIVGGSDGTTYLKSAEIYDPVTNTFTATASAPLIGRANHHAVLLQDGNVLIFGGNLEGTSQGLSTEIYLTAEDRFETAGDLAKPRVGSVAMLLNDGRVMVAGGSFPPDFASNSSSTEIYDPSVTLTNTVTTRWAAGPSMKQGRSYPAAVRLSTRGDILVSGGTGSGPSTAEIFNPTTFTFRAIRNLNQGRSRHTASLLANGDVLVIGGLLTEQPLRSVERYSPTTDLWSSEIPLNDSRAGHTATRMANDKILVVGSYSSITPVLKSAETFKDDSN